MMKLSEINSTDMPIDQLLITMMRLLIENAAAQRGLFLVPDEEDLAIVAAGNDEQIKVDTVHAASLYSTNDYPHNIINYVARTRETIIIGDRKGMSSVV